VLCQLSYSPGSNGVYSASCHLPDNGRMRTPSQRRALGALFLCLGLAFVGVAASSLEASTSTTGRVVIALAAGAIGLWLLGLGARALRR
jgi:hypothetical protein